jgi:hypothetical protein
MESTVVIELKKLYTEENGRKLFVKEFKANGHDYVIEESISYDRWIEWRKVQVELMYGHGADEIFASIKKAYGLLNQKNSEVVEAGIILHNLMSSVKAINDERIPEVIQLCSLFMNRVDEDRRTITPAMIQEKANDWREEGIDMQSFFMYAVNSIPNFLPIFESLIQSTSETKK